MDAPGSGRGEQGSGGDVGPAEPGLGTRKRLREPTIGGLLDEALALAVRFPGLYLRGLPGPLAVVLALGALVSLHRGLWGTLPFLELLWTRTLPIALLASLGWLARGAGHGVVARRLAHRLGREPATGTGSGTGALLAAAALGPVLVLPGLLFLLLPGVLAMGRLAPLPGLIAVDGLSLPEAAMASWERGRGRTLQVGMAFLATQILGGLVFVNLLFAGGVGVSMLRVLTGADTTGLARLASPLNEGWVLLLLALTFVLVDPITAILRSLLHLELRLGGAGADLESRWKDLLASQASGLPRVARLLLVSLPLLVSAGWMPSARAASAEVVSGPAGAEPVSLRAWEMQARDAARSLNELADGWDGAETIALRPLADLFQDTLSRDVSLPGGEVIPIDGASLFRLLPDRVMSEDGVAALRRTAERLEVAASDAAALRLGPSEGVLLASPQGALEAELAGGRYRLDRAASDSVLRDDTLRQRIAAWWRSLWTQQPQPARPPVAHQGDGLVALVATAAALLVVGMAVLGVRALLLARKGLPSRGARGSGEGAGPAGPSALDSSLREADAAAAAGDYARAVRVLFLAVLAHQASLGHIEPRPGRTNGEHRATFCGPSAPAQRFSSVSRAFDRARYGAAPTEPSTWARVRSDSLLLLPGGLETVP